MFEYALAIALEVSEVKNSHKEPAPIVLTEKQRMALIDLIDQLEKQKREAEDRALYWYQQQKQCGKKEI